LSGGSGGCLQRGEHLVFLGKEVQSGVLLVLLNQVKEETLLAVAVGSVEKWKRYEVYLLSISWSG
jgi:hypothetical protein